MPVALLFNRGSGFSSALIRWWTRSPFAHVAPALDAGADGPGAIYDAFWRPGVTSRPWRPFDADAVRVELPGADAAYWLGWLDRQVGKPYDRWAIVLCGLLKRVPGWLHVYDSRQGAWTCSRLSTVVAGKTGQAVGLPWPVTPGDLYQMLMADRLTGPTEGL